MNDWNLTEQLAPKAVPYWRMYELVTNIISALVLGVLFFLDWRFDWYTWIGWVLIGIAVLFLLSVIWSIISPPLLYKSWRYDLDAEFLYLQFGIWERTEQVIPMSKIQAVAMKQGPIMRKYGLASLSVDTMGSNHEIPALPKNIADQVRERIAQFAKIKEVEQ